MNELHIYHVYAQVCLMGKISGIDCYSNTTLWSSPVCDIWTHDNEPLIIRCRLGPCIVQEISTDMSLRSD